MPLKLLISWMLNMLITSSSLEVCHLEDTWKLQKMKRQHHQVQRSTSVYNHKEQLQKQLAIETEKAVLALVGEKTNPSIFQFLVPPVIIISAHYYIFMRD